MRTLLVLFSITLFSIFSIPGTASAQDNVADVEVTYGGWGATGGIVTWAAVTPFMQLTIGEILAPDDPTVCKITPERCQPSAFDYTLVGLTLAASLGVTYAGGWVTAWLAEEFELSPELGWGIAGGGAGLPIFGMIWFAVPRFQPAWLDTTLGSIVVFGGSIASGFYFSEVASRRGHAWPEFGIGIGGTLVGAGIGTLICGAEPCRAVPLLGALGGILGIGLSTFFWGLDPDTSATTPMELQRATQPLLQYGFSF